MVARFPKFRSITILKNVEFCFEAIIFLVILENTVQSSLECSIIMFTCSAIFSQFNLNLTLKELGGKKRKEENLTPKFKSCVAISEKNKKKVTKKTRDNFYFISTIWNEKLKNSAITKVFIS